jgi:acetylornithine deacetylase/succinyl-diaminopimelate desuccinylase-like protein
MAASLPAPRALEFARTLVGFNTVSANSNLALIHCIRDELARLGVKSRLSYDAGRTKANLFATLGEGKPAGIMVAYARSLEPAMQKVAPDTGFRFETICEIPSFLGSADGRPGAGAEPVLG